MVMVMMMMMMMLLQAIFAPLEIGADLQDTAMFMVHMLSSLGVHSDDAYRYILTLVVACRQSLRTPDGHLSPAAFSPVSRAAEAAAANLQAAGLSSVQLHGWPRPVAYRLWEQKTSAGVMISKPP